jgi:hypothetical protein
MTFTIPADLAAQFTRRIAPRERSRFLSQALAQKLAESADKLSEACKAANADPEVRSIEREFDAITAEIIEPWTAGRPARRRVVEHIVSVHLIARRKCDRRGRAASGGWSDLKDQKRLRRIRPGILERCEVF